MRWMLQEGSECLDGDSNFVDCLLCPLAPLSIPDS